jgi:glucosamine--fructose-6-phosphate aminotransferase (isomerizing)
MPLTPPPARAGHPFHMHDAIYAQPGALRLVTRGNSEVLATASERLRGMDRLILTGVGTSWHAALVGELLFAHIGRFGARARALSSFELAGYWPAPDARTAVLLVSHRGTNQSSRDALARARTGGAATLAVTGKGSDCAASADHVLHTVEQEASQAHTVSYTCALALLASLAAGVGADDDTPLALEAIPDQLALLLGQESWEELAARFGDRRRYFFVGGGPNTATAYEAALKMSETSYLTAAGFNCEEFLHGPWAAMEARDLLALVVLPGPSREPGVAAARLAKEVGATVLAIVQEGDRTLAGLATETIEIPAVNELLSPILTVVPFQLLTYHWAVLRGTDPDTLRAGDPAYDRARTCLPR